MRWRAAFLVQAMAMALAGCGGEAVVTTASTLPAGERYRITFEAPDETSQDVLEATATIMSGRLQATGLQGFDIDLVGQKVIVDVVLPGEADPEEVEQILATVGQLTFRPVLDVSAYGASPLVIDYFEYAQSTGVTGTEPPDLTVVLPEGISLCDPAREPAEQPGCVDGDPDSATFGLTLSDDPAKVAWLADLDTGEMFELAPARVLSTDIADAQAGYSQGGSSDAGLPFGVSGGGVGQWVVYLEFTDAGAIKFQEVTRELASYGIGDPRRRFAIVLDGVVAFAPQMADDVNPAVGIADGAAVITMGPGDGEQEARDLAVVLRYGALPVLLTVVSIERATGG